MQGRLYLALVKPGFQLTDEVIQYFADEQIELVKHLGKLGMLILKSEQNLSAYNLRYIDYIELESNFNLFSSGV